jgi:hypothetical protein
MAVITEKEWGAARMHSGTRADVLGRTVGMLVFLLGIGLIIGVFVIAYRLFNTPPAAALGLTFTGDAKTDPPAAQIGTRVVWLLLQLGYLFVMSISGSLIASKGINLYFSALQGSPVNVSSKAPVSTTISPPV